MRHCQRQNAKRSSPPCEFNPLIIIVWLSLFIVLLFFGRIIYYESVTYDWDAYLFWTVGKGILNGLTPYQDLFETKPPGVFFLSALSFGLTGTPILMHILNSLSILAIGITPLAFLILSKKVRLSEILVDAWTALISLFVLLFSIVLASYASFRGGNLYTESFAILFVCGYILLWARVNEEQPISWLRASAAGVLILATVGTREPFILVIIAVALFFAKSSEHIWKLLLFPMGLATILGLALLWVSGIIGPFFKIYIPYMLNQRLYIESQTPIFLRGLEPIVLQDIISFSPLMLAILFALLLHFSYITLVQPNGRILGYIKLFAIPYLTLLSVGLGGDYFEHHFTAALPSYLALLIAFATTTDKVPRHILKYLLALGICCCLFFVISLDLHPYYKHRLISDIPFQDIVASADYLDTVMDASNTTRYAFIGTVLSVELCVYSEHSPYGPIFNQNEDWIDLPLFNGSFFSNFDKADIVVVGEYSPSVMKHAGRVGRILKTSFTLEPWDSIKQIPQPNQTTYRFYFRKTSG
jgi:hypothetical protein